MDRSSVLTLINVTRERDAYGVWRDQETTTDVFCQVDSVSQSEFYEAGRNGLNPQYRFRMFYGDYNNQELVSYNGSRYSVYRTYLRRDDIIELYVERKGGSNG